MTRGGGAWLPLVVLTAACATRSPAPTVPVPTPEAGRVRAAAAAAAPVGQIQPIALAVTNGRPTPVQLDARQVYAHAGVDRVAPQPPAEAARLAGGERLPGAVRAGAVGAVTGGVLGAVGGAIAGAIQGGIGLAVAAGSAVGAFFGAVAGVFSGGGSAPDIEGFEDRALHDATLAEGFSATGYVYYPAGTYDTLEILLRDDAGQVDRLTIPVATAP